VERDGELDHSQAGADVPASARAHIDETGSDVARENRKLLSRETAYVSGSFDAIENRHAEQPDPRWASWKVSDTSRLSLDDKARQDIEFRRQKPGRPQRGAAFGHELRRPRGRFLESHEGRVGALPQVEVASGGLPQAIGGGSDIEDIVGDLKRQTDRVAEAPERLELGRFRLGGNAA